MARHKKPSYTGPDPLDIIVDIFSAILGFFGTRSQIKRDYREGHGQESVNAATRIYGYGASRKDSHWLGIGGLLGINSAVNSINRQREREHERVLANDPTTVSVAGYQSIDNRYAWRLNCEDGKAYGVVPEDYETRDQYNAALNTAKQLQARSMVNQVLSDDLDDDKDVLKVYTYCRVSRLDNGKNEYYLSESGTVKIGDTVTVPTETGLTGGIVLSVENHTVLTAPVKPKNTKSVIQ